MIYIYPSKKSIPSARNLALFLGGRAIKRTSSRFRPDNKFIINWGATDCPYHVTLNKPEAVTNAVDKRRAFELMSQAGVQIPKFTTSRSEAMGYKKAVARTLTRSRAGNGIIIASGEDVPYAPLYTDYIPKTDEYRIHVFNGEIIFQQRKGRRLTEANPNWQVRTHANGFVFTNQNVETPPDAQTQALKAVAALNLDFGACDVVWNAHRQRAYVLEVNTAPNMVGTTLSKYSDAIRRVYAT